MLEILERWRRIIFDTEMFVVEDSKRADITKDGFSLFFWAVMTGFTTLAFRYVLTLNNFLTWGLVILVVAAIVAVILVAIQGLLFLAGILLGAKGDFKNQLHFFRVIAEPVAVAYIILGPLALPIEMLKTAGAYGSFIFLLFLLVIAFPYFLWRQFRQIEIDYKLGIAKSVVLTALALPEWLLLLVIIPLFVFLTMFGGIS